MDLILGMIVLLISSLVSYVFYIISNNINKNIVNKDNMWIIPYTMPLISTIPTAIMLLLVKYNYGFLNFKGFLDVKSWIVMIITVAIVVIVVSHTKNDVESSEKGVILHGLEGCTIELLQRLFMQNFIFILASNFHMNYAAYSSILLNSILWCLCILYKQKKSKTVNSKKDIALEMAASFIFSLGIGYVYFVTGFILMPMIAHFLKIVVLKSVKKYKLVTLF